MAPLKTYGSKSKKRNLLVITEAGRIKRKPLQNVRRPLSTLQSANVRPIKELVSKAKQNTIFADTSLNVNNNASMSSPSFPGSEELSSIWHRDSTFDKLLQTSPKP